VGQINFEHPQDLPEPLHSEWHAIEDARVRDCKSLAAVSTPDGGIVLVNTKHHRKWHVDDLKLLQEAVKEMDLTSGAA
jgi:hypothetical protein